MINQYLLLDTLGVGSFAEVRLCQDTTTEELYAMKIVRKDHAALRRPTPPVVDGGAAAVVTIDSPSGTAGTAPPLTPRRQHQLQQYEQLRTEIVVMKRLSHPNVLRLVEVLDDPVASRIYLVLEYMARGDLLRVLHGDANTSTCQPLGDHGVWAILRQVAAGLLYLHEQVRSVDRKSVV